MGVTLEFCVFSYLLNPLNDFHKTSSELMCRTHDSAMQTQSQGHTLKSWNSAAGDMAVLQTATLFVLVLCFVVWNFVSFLIYHLADAEERAGCFTLVFTCVLAVCVLCLFLAVP